MKKKLVLLLTLIFFISLYSQDNPHEFELVTSIKTTPVKSQGRSGTCWAFAATSFIETELLRMGYEEIDISEMFTVRHKLMSMAENHVSYHGRSNFGDGGQAHDLMNVIKSYGFVPEEQYTGKNIGLETHNHGEMTSVIGAMLEAVLKKRSGKLTPKWKDAVAAVLDTYLGTPPKSFNYNNKKYAPSSFVNNFNFNPYDYVEITSYTDAPFYTKYILKLPDNWTNEEYYNVPMNDMIEIIDNALMNGYSICWDGDAGSDNFYRKSGYAVIPENKRDSKAELSSPEKEKVITQEMRQIAFENFDVTDDHLMHIVGIGENQEGTKFYYTKNSWGIENKGFDGYWYMSKSYVELKTVAIMVHKDAIPDIIRTKMGI